VVAATADPLFADLFRVAASTGLRRGERCGLRWQDIDTKALTTPKTHQTRSVPLSQVTQDALDRRRAAARSWEREAFVFTEDRSGSVPIHPDRVSRIFTEARKGPT
jgi:integrase